MSARREAGQLARSTMAKVSVRILPLIFLSYLVAYMDRSNISFAALQMNVDLGFSATVYGTGAGLFFVGYALFEVPSNLLLARFGARRWIARIMLTWGVISAAMLVVRTPVQFYAMRFLLGVAEAGFYPGVLFYLSHWFPNAWRARAVSRFYIATPVAMVLMGSVAGPLLGLGGVMGLKGWQWLFLAEGAPAVLLALLLLRLLPDEPAKASWLSDPEKRWLQSALDADTAGASGDDHRFLQALTDPLVVRVGSIMALMFACSNALGFSAPKLLAAATGWSATQVGWVTASGGVLGTVAMLLVGWSSDRRGERRLHIIGVIGLTAVSVSVMALATGPLWTLIGYLGFATIQLSLGVLTSCLVADAVRPASRPVSFAAMNTIAQVGGFAGPLLWGMAADRTGGYRLGLWLIPAVLAVAIALTLQLRRRAAVRPAETFDPHGSALRSPAP